MDNTKKSGDVHNGSKASLSVFLLGSRHSFKLVSNQSIKVDEVNLIESQPQVKEKSRKERYLAFAVLEDLNFTIFSKSA